MQLPIPKPARYFGIFLGILLLLGLPLIVKSPYVLFVIELILMYIILTAGLNLPVGLTGQISLCQAAFWGLGAYFSAILTEKMGISVWIALPSGRLVCRGFRSPDRPGDPTGGGRLSGIGDAGVW